jgi:hypothetical protein
LVTEAYDWDHGVFLGSTASEDPGVETQQRFVPRDGCECIGNEHPLDATLNISGQPNGVTLAEDLDGENAIERIQEDPGFRHVMGQADDRRGDDQPPAVRFICPDPGDQRPLRHFPPPSPSPRVRKTVPLRGRLRQNAEIVHRPDPRILHAAVPDAW